MVAVPQELPQLLGAQDVALLSREESLADSIWSTQIESYHPLADGLLEVMQHVISGQG